MTPAGAVILSGVAGFAIAYCVITIQALRTVATPSFFLWLSVGVLGIGWYTSPNREVEEKPAVVREVQPRPKPLPVTKPVAVQPKEAFVEPCSKYEEERNCEMVTFFPGTIYTRSKKPHQCIGWTNDKYVKHKQVGSKTYEFSSKNNQRVTIAFYDLFLGETRRGYTCGEKPAGRATFIVVPGCSTDYWSPTLEVPKDMALQIDWARVRGNYEARRLWKVVEVGAEDFVRGPKKMRFCLKNSRHDGDKLDLKWRYIGLK
ncbi:MAG: hypothetical protein AAF438_16480 [Pseudomonadota bacterium]